MKRLYLVVTFFAVLMATSQAWSDDPVSSGLLLTGSWTHCDSIRLPEDATVLEESNLVRYMTGGMPQIVITRENDPEYLYFRIIPFTNHGDGLDYNPAEVTACLQLDNRLPAEDQPDLEPPVIIGFYPPAGATEIPVTTNLWLKTSEPVRKDSGMIRLITGDSLFTEINILSEAVSISGDSVSISLPELLKDKPYHVFLDSTCLSDMNNNHPDWNNNWYFRTISGDLYFSEYVEGEGYLKGFELINPSSAALSLDHYRIHYSRNGAGLTGLYYFPQGKALMPGQVFVVVHQAIIDLDTFELPAGCQADILTSTIVTFNGNDALALEKTDDNGLSWQLIDLLGDPLSILDFDVAGISGAAKDHSLLRKRFIRFGNTDWAVSAGSSLFSSEWKVYPVNYLSNLGYPSPYCDSSDRISSFNLPGVTDSVRILNDSNRIYVFLKPDIKADSMVPQIVFPALASISPSPDAPVPVFPGLMNYTVTAEDRAHISIWTIILQYPGPELINQLVELKAFMPASQRIQYSGMAMITAIKDSLAFIQDSTAGIMITGSPVRMAGIDIGSNLEGLSGQLTKQAGITCLYLTDKPVIIPGDEDMVIAADLLIQDLLEGNERYESMLVRIRNARFTTPGTFFVEGQNYRVNQGTDTITVRIDFFDTELTGRVVPGFATVTGILIRSGNTLYIAPRFSDDMDIQSGSYEYDPSDALVVIPNPAQGLFTITGHHLTGPARTNVFNLAGQKVYESEFTEIASVDIIINLESQPAGTYVFFMTAREHIYICLLVKTE